MKRAFTYKDLSLIAGIAVAVIIVFTLWAKQTPGKPAPQISKPSFSISDLKASLIDRTVTQLIP